MGRITVFTRSDDLNSKQVLKELDRRCIPYEEINLSWYPGKAKDLALALQLTSYPPSVPHVYFNTRYIGGVEECRTELKSWDSSKRYKSARQRYDAEIGSGFDPTSEHLTLPNPTTAVFDSCAKTRHVKLLLDLPGRRSLFIRELMELLKEWLPLKKCEYNEQVFENSVTGLTLFSTLQNALDVSMDETIRFVQDLCDQGVIRHVDTEQYPLPKKMWFFSTNHDVYRLQCHAEPNVLNSYLRWPVIELQPENCLGVVDNLCRLLTVMEMSSLDPESGLLDAEHCVKLKKFSIFEEAICELQHLSNESLFQLSENEMTAFALNLHSVLMRYAYLKIGIPKNETDHMHMMDQTKFYLSGKLYTLQNLVDMLLRKSSNVSNGANSSHPPSFPILVKQDKRIYFALFLGPHNGCRWSTTFSLFSATNLDQELEMAAKVFCMEERHVNVIRASRTLELLSPVFKTYCADFGLHESSLPEIIVPYLSGEKRLALVSILKSSRSKTIKIVYLAPRFGMYTVSGPWYPTACYDNIGSNNNSSKTGTKGRKSLLTRSKSTDNFGLGSMPFLTRKKERRASATFTPGN